MLRVVVANTQSTYEVIVCVSDKHITIAITPYTHWLVECRLPRILVVLAVATLTRACNDCEITCVLIKAAYVAVRDIGDIEQPIAIAPHRSRIIETSTKVALQSATSFISFFVS